MKVKFEKVKVWFTPIQACRYLFEDASDQTDTELLNELARLTNEYKLTAFIKNYQFCKTLLPQEDVEANKRYEDMMQVYNSQNYEPLPIMHNYIKLDWFYNVFVENVNYDLIVPDIYDFEKQYAENNYDIDTFFGYEVRNASDETSIFYRFFATKFDLGFTKDELDRFINEFTKPTPIKSEELTTKERKTLLVIIAALAKENKLDINKRSKTSELIANLTQIIGCPISATTIENHLKMIPDALKTRAR